MLPTVDPAILGALSLEPTSTKLVSHGSSSFASTYKLTSTTLDGKDLTYFVKTGAGPSADLMFRGEHASLNAIHDAVPNFCPRSHAHGAMRRASEGGVEGSSGLSGRYFLVTDWLDLGSHAAAGSGMSLAEKLAKLHTTPAPIPRGYDRPMYGFPVATCCGATVQENGWKESWAEFYAENRLRAVWKEGVRKHGSDRELAEAVERVAGTVVPRLLGDGHLKGVRPVVVHGDLWSGNHGRGRIGGKGGVEEVVYDPSCVYGHSEYELGIMRMFGGFGSGFWREYEKLVPKSEPREEFEDRVALYELYHHLNHFALFGGGYRGGAMSIMRKLISKYGS
ncbi:fructosamine kinase [Podospora aff. communis PSN243]|uniref:protein-ribulosamine 3-kinase n=1 Tax=Podospora aff. communis PSN243 TaxID=3040156 RepID=A0AAV9H6Q0_9PEZI|nr:fructosamine kinase [Podospora aff. communis PSN243]